MPGQEEAVLLQYLHNLAHTLVSFFFRPHTAVFRLLQNVKHAFAIEDIAQWVTMLLQNMGNSRSNQVLHRWKVVLQHDGIYLGSTLVLKEFVQRSSQGTQSFLLHWEL